MANQVYTALGLMSGTSLDGVDAAFIETDGERVFAFGPTLTIPFAERTDIEGAITAALNWQFDGPAPNIFAQAEDAIDRAHVQAISEICDANPQWARRMDIIGYHGQTILHHPATRKQQGRTLQLGRSEVLACKFNVPCAYDFRTADVAAGGQGAPLAPIYHEALSEMTLLRGRVAVINIGGVSNVTLIEEGRPLRATDCGPGNGPLDSWMALKSGAAIDRDGASAWAGHVDHARVERWLRRPFFKRAMPRSADRYDFDVLGAMRGMNVDDGAATLASFTAQAIARDLNTFDPDIVIVCGGGRRNLAIMGMLSMHLGKPVSAAEDFGWDGDALEAQAFGYLAVRTLRNLPISFPGTTGAPRAMSGGQVFRPRR
ncbi:anhydro-N-acetylmuramic acid kinase [Litorimonas sp. RW-G-Af-16]|uniref:anhydro-N-acetylmuramic acid kinase n=1 Tax=Litorimonas sp. RW-G-Af-16 TaxID=3241168 RepID=UPI00390C55D8